MAVRGLEEATTRGRIRKVLRNYHLEDFAESLFVGFVRTGRGLLGTDSRAIEKYFGDHSTRKLHIGCGSHILEDWLNSDYLPTSQGVVCLDATKPFRLKSGTFDYVFSEHVIEHMAYLQGLQMLSECYRVLKPTGKVRVATPDLQFLIDLGKTDKSELQKDYIIYATDTKTRSAPCYADTFVINSFMGSWGHKFIYDEITLRRSLEEVGFTEVSKCELSESDDEELRNLENVGRMPEGFLRLETLVLEGTKP